MSTEEIVEPKNWLLSNSLTSSISSAINLVIGTNNTQNNLLDEQLNDLEELNVSNESINGSNRISTRVNNKRNSNELISPRSLSESSIIMKDIMVNHPTFSVFRKSNSLDSLIDSSPETLLPQYESNVNDQQQANQYTPELQTSTSFLNHLKNSTNNNKTPEEEEEEFIEAERSFPSLAIEEEGSAEWHLSSGEEMASLHWGDNSQDSIEFDQHQQQQNQNQQPLQQSLAISNLQQSTSSVRLIDFNSPPTHRMSTSRTPSAPLVHFSPLSLAPSPLLGLPPPTPHEDSPSVRLDFNSHHKAILKKTGTPGTGRSVRFSASTTREPTPPSMARFADAGVEIEDDYDGVEAEDSRSSKDIKEVGELEESRAVASFLSKLQAAIPSPDNSLSDSSSSSPPLSSQQSQHYQQQPRVVISSPSTPSIYTNSKLDSMKVETTSIFDTSIPNSFLGTSVAEGNSHSRLDFELTRSTSTILSSSPSTSTSYTPIASNQIQSNYSKSKSINEVLEDSSLVNPREELISTLTPKHNSSFYKEFLQKRAASSTIAAEQLGQLVNQELSTGKSVENGNLDSGSKTSIEEAFVSATSVSVSEVPQVDVDPIVEVEYYEGNDSTSSEDAVVASLTASETIHVFSNINDALSPIYEESEENTTFSSVSPSPSPSNSPSKRSNTFKILSSSLTAPQQTPSKLTNREMILHSVTPKSIRQSKTPIHFSSPNPFASTTVNPSILQALLSVSNDLTTNSSSQRFLLSSLITNLHEEIERKDLMIENLQRRTEQIEFDWNSAIMEIEENEQRCSNNNQNINRSPSRSKEEQAKILALEELIEQLAIELKTRTSSSRINIQQAGEEITSLRSELQKSMTSVRDAEIRLKHAQASQNEAEELRSRAEEEKIVLKEQVLESQHAIETRNWEKEEELNKVLAERQEQEILIADLRMNIISSTSSNPLLSASHSSNHKTEKEWTSLTREVNNANFELVALHQRNDENIKIINTLRQEAKLSREELMKANELTRKVSLEMESSKLDARTLLNQIEDELTLMNQSKTGLENELKIVEARCTSLEEETNRLLEENRIKDEQIHSQVLVWKESLAAQTKLVDSISRIESEANERVTTLEEAQKNLTVLLDDRDRRLVDTQQKLATQTAAAESLKQELTRSKELIVILRRESADREVRIIGLKKNRFELMEDKSGLEMALDVKQHEAAMWKRQLSTARLPYLQESNQAKVLPARKALTAATPSNPRRVSSTKSATTTTVQTRPSSSHSDTPTVKGSSRGRASPILNLPSTPSHLPIPVRSSFGSAGKTKDGSRATLKENAEPTKRKAAVRC